LNLRQITGVIATIQTPRSTRLISRSSQELGRCERHLQAYAKRGQELSSSWQISSGGEIPGAAKMVNTAAKMARARTRESSPKRSFYVMLGEGSLPRPWCRLYLRLEVLRASRFGSHGKKNQESDQTKEDMVLDAKQIASDMGI
jgi:hypothetical protein